MLPKVVITDYEYPDVKREQEIALEAGFSLYDYQAKTEEELIEITKDADAVIIQYCEITENVIKHMKHCKIIIKYGIGINNIDVKAATEKGIYVCNIPDYGVDEVSNHAIAGIMSLSRKLNISDRKLREGIWDFRPITPLKRFNQSVVGILGYGRIGKMVAHKLSSFGVRILAHDICSQDRVVKDNVEFVDFETLLKESDYITIHVPLEEKTYHMINDEAIAKMKPNVMIINTARGPIIEEKALVKALQEKRIAGASIDVFEIEPLSIDNPLITLENVILSPHTAWYSEQSIEALQKKAMLEVVNVLNGNLPYNLCNPEVLER